VISDGKCRDFLLFQGLGQEKFLRITDGKSLFFEAVLGVFRGLLPPSTNLPPPEKSFIYWDFRGVVAEWQ
jgi:hypothetical protein